MTMTMTMTMTIQVQRMCLEARSVLCIQHLLPPKESHSWAHTCISIHTPNHTYFMLIKILLCFIFLVETQCISSMLETICWSLSSHHQLVQIWMFFKSQSRVNPCLRKRWCYFEEIGNNDDGRWLRGKLLGWCWEGGASWLWLWGNMTQMLVPVWNTYRMWSPWTFQRDLQLKE